MTGETAGAFASGMALARLAWLLGMVASAAAASATVAGAEPRAAPVDQRSAAELHAAARAAFGELHYRETVELLDRAWRRGDSQPAQLRAIFALAGRAAASMGRDAAAQLWFQRWLCLEPAAELPAGASPKLRAALSRARDALGGASLAIHAVRRGDGAGVELTIRDPLALAASVRTGGARTPLATAHVTLPTARGDIELLDTYGNVLASAAIEPAVPGTSETAATAAPAGAAPTTVAARDSPPWQGRWSTWAIAAGGFATLGVAAWWVADDADTRAGDSGDEQEEADLRRRRDVATWASRGALVAMGAAITVGIVVYVRGRDQRIIATPHPGGGGVAWRIAF